MPTTTAALQEILDRFLAGDPAAKNALIERAYDRLVVLSRSLLNKFPAARGAEDTTGVLNEAYARISKALDDLRPATVRLFFGLVALQIRRVLLDLVRKLRLPRGPLEELLSVVPDPETPDADDVRDALRGLEDEEREVVVLLFFNGLTQAEAAEMLGVHEDTVKRRWARARLKLARALAAYNEGDASA